MSKTPEKIEINTDFIRLDSFLKFTAAVSTGGEAKQLIQDGAVSVNGEICLMRTKKIYKGDIVDFYEQSFLVCGVSE